MLAARICFIPTRVHTFTGQVWATETGSKRSFLKFLDRLIGKMTTHNLVDSKSQRNFLVKESVLSRNKSLVFGSGSAAGVDLKKYKSNKRLGNEIRTQLGIPKDAVVFGRHGGWESFDQISAQEAIRLVARKHPEIHFLFLNTADFLHHHHPNVHFLPASTDRIRVGRFIHTCDAMIHGRSRGETFGMAVAESAICGKPVFTWRHSPERNHLRWIREEAWLYSETEELAEKLMHFQKGETMDCSFVEEFSPVRVMEKFRKVFLS
jgi:glycosyltransferase involved in cell wall biosynthesis